MSLLRFFGCLSFSVRRILWRWNERVPVKCLVQSKPSVNISYYSISVNGSELAESLKLEAWASWMILFCAFTHNNQVHWFCVHAKLLQLCPTFWNPVDCGPPGSSVHGFSRQEYWSGLPGPTPGHLPNPGIEPASLMYPAFAGGFFTTSATWDARSILRPWLLMLE